MPPEEAGPAGPVVPTGGPGPITPPGGPGPITPPGGPVMPPLPEVLPGMNGSAAMANGSAVMPPPPGATGNDTEAGRRGGQVGAMAEFEQCGGAGGNCKSHGESACVDAIFPGKGCAAGLECVRQNFWYRQCLKPDVVKVLGSAWITAAPAPRAECPKGFIGFQQQCGGKGGQCKDDAKMAGQCEDKAVTGACCETGTTCQRVNEWYWQCQGQPTNSAASN